MPSVPIVLRLRFGPVARGQGDAMVVDCRECGSKSEAHEAGSFDRIKGRDEPIVRFTLLSCLNCGAPILVKQFNLGRRPVGGPWGKPCMMFPAEERGATPNPPEEIRLMLEEAYAHCRATEYTIATDLCRKTLMAMAIACDVRAPQLETAIHGMRERDFIDDKLLEWWSTLSITCIEGLEALRVPLARSEAQDALEFTSAAVDHVFARGRRIAVHGTRRTALPAPQ